MDNIPLNTTPLLKFNLLGTRNYVDITSIIEGLWLHFGYENRSKIKNFKLTVHKQINTHCHLIFKNEKFRSPYENKTVVEFSWDIENLPFYGFLVESDQKNLDRVTEPNLEFESHIHVDGKKAIISKPYNNSVAYNITKMGKFLISKHFDPSVQIVKLDFSRLVMDQLLETISLEIGKNINKQFTQLNCYIDDQKIGNVLLIRRSPHG